MPETFWLFTDGGAERRKDGTFFGSFGYALFREKKDSLEGSVYGSGYDPQTTVPRMEFTGLIEGLKALNTKLVEGERAEIYIVMDALNTVESINSWHKNWIKNATADGTWRRKDLKTKKFEPVLNQDLLKIIIDEVNKLKLHHYVKVMHMNSHITKKGFKECYKYFIKKNEMFVSEETFNVLIHCNELVDKLLIETRRKHQ